MEKNRRQLLSAGVLALPAAALAASSAKQTRPCRAPLAGPMAEYLPNAVVWTHENRKALFYDDLLAGKIVTINFIRTRDQVAGEVTRNLVKLQRILGERVGDDIFMYTITTDPLHDTPRVLRQFVRQHEVGRGWLFLTGKPSDMRVLLGQIFSGPHDHHAEDSDAGQGIVPGPGCSRGLVRYGNLATGSFGSFAASHRPEYMAERFTWVGFRKEPAAIKA